MNDLDEQRNANLALVPTLARVECPNQGTWARPACSYCGHSEEAVHKFSHKTLPNPPGVKYELAETVACTIQWWYIGDEPMVKTCDKLPQWQLTENSQYTLSRLPHPSECVCQGTGHVLVRIDAEDEWSIGEHAGRLQRVAMLDDEGEDYGDTLDTGSPEWDAWYAFCRAAFKHDLPAAEDAIGELMLAMQEVKDAS